MVFQCKKNTSLLELLESHARGSTLEVAVQNRPPTPLFAITSPFEPVNKKRKGDTKDKEMLVKGEVVPIKELKPQKGTKIAKGAQRKTSAEGMCAKRVSKHHPRVPT